MNLPENPDSLDALLREDNSYVEDNGFTRRVISSLPRRRNVMRPALLLTTVLLCSVLSIWWLPWRALLYVDWSNAQTCLSQTWRPLVCLTVVFGALAWGVISAFAWED